MLRGEESRRAGSSKGEVGNIGELGRSDRDPRRDLHGVEEPRGRDLWVTGEEHQDLACTVGVAGEERPGDHAGEERSWATVGAHQRGEKLRPREIHRGSGISPLGGEEPRVGDSSNS